LFLEAIDSAKNRLEIVLIHDAELINTTSNEQQVVLRLEKVILDDGIKVLFLTVALSSR